VWKLSLSACDNDDIISENAYYVVLFRLNRMSLPAAGINDLDELIRRVRIAYNNPHIERLTTYIGLNITELDQARVSPSNRAVVALLPGDRFFLPALAVGDVVPVQTRDRVVRVKTLSIAPRVFQWVSVCVSACLFSHRCRSTNRTDF
jgi:hypothetical protein